MSFSDLDRKAGRADSHVAGDLGPDYVITASCQAAKVFPHDKKSGKILGF